METPLSISIQKFNEYKIESNGNKFNVKIILSSKIIIEIYELTKIQSSFYINEFSLEELVKLSKGFKICEDINEAYEILIEIFEAKKSSIKLKEDNSVILTINIALPGGKTQSTELLLKAKEINKNKLISELIKKVNNLEEKNKKLEEEINDIKEWKKKIEKLFIDKITENEIRIDSKIIEITKDLDFLINRLKSVSNIKQKNINFNLLYRATRDGDNFNDFHSRVDNKNSTLTIIKTSIGSKFGVFLEVPFKQTNNPIVDDKSFIFSLDLKKIYNSKKGTYSLNDLANVGILLDLYFQPIRIYQNCLSNNESYTDTAKSINYNSYIGFEKDYELNNNLKNFKVEEMETFQILFN